MERHKSLRIISLAAIMVIAFAVFFADGYLQWINSDTAGEAYALSQEIGFPQALFSEKGYRSRITGHLLSFVPFNVGGSIYREIFDDPVNALYFSQGLMTGTIYTLLILISAAYVSFCSSLLSWRYLFSALMLMLFTMALDPITLLNAPFGLTVRFSHQAVMTNYVGTMTIALIALFPLWRYYCTKKWDDIHENTALRTIFYLLIIAASLSSTATSIWLAIFSLSALTVYCARTAKNGNAMSGIGNTLARDSRSYPLLLMALLGIVAIGADSVTGRAVMATSDFNLGEYLRALFSFFSASASTIVFPVMIVLGVFGCMYLRKNGSDEGKLLLRIIPLILIVNLIFIFIIGLPKATFRFGGHNLGRDTTLIPTWTVALWVISASICFFKNRKFSWIAPFILFALLTNSTKFFSFPYYGYRSDQKLILEQIYAWNASQPVNETLVMYWNGLAFSYDECLEYTIPMLKKVGIISPDREVVVAP